MKSKLLISALSLLCLNGNTQTIATHYVHNIVICGDTAKGNKSISANSYSVKSWGSNRYGALGNGTSGGASCTCGGPNCCENAFVTVLNSVNFIAASTGSDHSLLLKNDNTVWAFGYNYYNQLGDGTFTNKSVPTQIPNLSNVKATSCGAAFSLFLKNDGTVWACGYNYDGELGDGTNVDKHVPTQIPSLSNIIAIAGGEKHSLFLKSDGTVWACGWNLYGQLGNGTTVNKNIPTQITGLSNIVAIGAGIYHSLFVKNDGTTWSCGRNDKGQLGDGTSANIKLLPSQITTLSNIKDVKGGASHSLFLDNNGSVWACGWNVVGQLGDATVIDKTTPIQLNTISNVAEISCGTYHSLFLKNNGKLYSTGANTYGQLGLGDYAERDNPVILETLCSIYIPLAVNEYIKNENEFKIYPTISEGIFKIEGNNKVNLISVYTLQGQKAFEIDNNIVLPHSLNISNLIDGIYFVQIKSGNYITNKKIIIAK